MTYHLCYFFFTVLECGLPADIPNAKLLFVNGTRAFQSVIAYNCNPGYQAVGRTTLMCDVDERWNGPPPRYVQWANLLNKGGMTTQTYL